MINKIARAWKDYEYCAHNLMYIRTRAQEIVPFNWYYSQHKIHKLMLSSKRPRIIVLKPRQEEGFSTYFCGAGFHILHTQKNFRGLHLAQDDEASKSFAEMYQTFETHFGGVNGNPLLQYKQKRFGADDAVYPELNSKVHFGTAGQKSSAPKKGRSKNYNFVHLSEFAFWTDPESTMTGLRSCVADEDYTYIIIESTPSSMGHLFYRMCQGARQGINEFTFFFFPWYEDPKLRLPLEPGEVLELDEEELEAQGRYSLDLEQMKWRKMKKRQYMLEKGAQGIRNFKQEYPENWLECFMANAFGYVSPETVQDHMARIEDENQQAISVLGKPYIKMFEDPRSSDEYVIGIDSSEGLDVGDYDYACAWNVQTGNQAGFIHGKFALQTWADYCCEFGKYLNNALLIPEANNHGWMVIERMSETNRYQRIYRDPVKRSISGVPRNIQRKGFYTSSNSKKKACDKFKIALDHSVRNSIVGSSEYKVYPNDVELCREMLEFEEKDGKLGAVSGSHDDRFMGAVIGFHGIEAALQKVTIYG
uniref:Putative terminase n=1 Tax=viral metagenome TaxID=1070528 RepID=A0A6M3IJR6_9ZZZZ